MDYTTELYRLASELFLFLVSFRRKVQKGFRVDIDEVAGPLDAIFDSMDRKSRSDPRLDALYQRAKYPLVVLADEILLHSGWEHADEWDGRLLEERMFGTNIGGEKYFTIANELRWEEKELAVLLYTGLSLGFGGRYRERPEKLSEIRQKLYQHVSEYLADVSEKITPLAYHVTPKTATRLSPMLTTARIAIVAVGLFLAYWIATRLVWSQALSDLRTIVERIDR